MRLDSTPGIDVPAISRVKVIVTLIVSCAVMVILMLGWLLESKLQGPVRQWAETRATNIAATALTNAVQKVLADAGGVQFVRSLAHSDTGPVGFTYAWEELLQIKLAIAKETVKALDGLSSQVIHVPLGELTGLSLASGSGPMLPVRILPVGAVTTDMRFDFQSQGINQVLHRIYVDAQVQIKVIAPFQGVEVLVREQIPVTTELIQGRVPDTIINWSGSLDELRGLR